jgi:hypothetical protein
MRKNLLLLASLFFGVTATAQLDENGYYTVNIAMQPGYASQVYYKLGSDTQTQVAAASWDLAFQKAVGQNLGAVRVNDHKAGTFYEASANVADWATIDVANEGTWTKLYNSEITWSEGAFDNGSDNTPQFGFGWGLYDMGDHHVRGTRIFVLKTSATNYKKIILEDLNPINGTFAFKYATWNGTAWSADQTATINYADNAGTAFIYYSLETNATVTVAPADNAWDFVFRKYNGLVPSQGGDVMYGVTGALHNSTATGVTIAAVEEAGTLTDFTLPATDAYSSNINTIGDKWKVFNQGAMAYEFPDKTYYVKYADGTIYRMYFLTFEGSATGNLSFKLKNVTPTAGINDFAKESFAVYPNPSVNKTVTVAASQNGNISIYALTGAKVFEAKAAANSQELNLSNLNAGIYIVKFEAGNATVTKKLVIQ